MHSRCVFSIISFDPEPAVFLHDAGIYVQVPSPARYAIHKLIVTRRRPEGLAKRDKDLQQAEALLEALVEKRPHDLKLAWQEAYARGHPWRQLLAEGLSHLHASVRDLTLRAIDVRRSIIPRLDLNFNNPPARYDFSRDVVLFTGNSLGGPVECAVGRETLDDYFGADGLAQEGRVECFLKNRSKIERMARTKYLSWPIEEPNVVPIKSADAKKLVET